MEIHEERFREMIEELLVAIAECSLNQSKLNERVSRLEEIYCQRSLSQSDDETSL